MISAEGKAGITILGILDDKALIRIQWADGIVSRMWMTEEEFCKFRYGEGAME